MARPLNHFSTVFDAVARDLIFFGRVDPFVRETLPFVDRGVKALSLEGRQLSTQVANSTLLLYLGSHRIYDETPE